jgi:hypothetical protein
MRTRGALCVALVVGGWPAVAAAQAVEEAAPAEGEAPEAMPGEDPGFVVPTQAQFELYREGAAAFQDGDYEKARQLFLASLRLGELNVTYLNYGRTLFRLGDCVGASEAYARALTAPRIASPTPLQVLEKVEEYRLELARSCPSTLQVECAEAGVQFYLDTMGPLPCDGRALPVLPGVHTVSAQKDGRRGEVKVEVGQLQQARLQVVLPEEVGGEVGPPVAPVEEEAPRWLVGAQMGLLLNAPVEASVADEATTVNFGSQREGSLLSIRAHGAVRIWDGIHLGVEGALYPDYRIEQEGVAYLPHTQAWEVSGQAMYVFSPTPLSPFLLAEGGWLGVLAEEEGLEGLSGLQGGGGAGLLWSLGAGLHLRFEVRASVYEVARTLELSRPTGRDRGFVDLEGEATESLRGQRVWLGLGMGFGG